MRNTQLVKDAFLTQGVSSQPPHMRRPGQVGDAVNAEFTVARGAQTRNPTKFRWLVSGVPSASDDGAIHPIVRDENEAYIAVTFRAGMADRVIRVYDLEGNTATITGLGVDANQAYLNQGQATSDDIIFASQIDFTVIANRTTQLGVEFTDDYVVDETVALNATRLRWTPADGSHFFVSGPEEYWLYDVDGVTFGRRGDSGGGPIDSDGGAAWGVPTGNYNNVNATLTAVLLFSRQAVPGTNAAYTEANRQLTLAGAFADYRYANGDWIKITAGTGFSSPKWFPVESKVDDDTIVLAASGSPPGSDTADVAFTHVGMRYPLEWSITGDTPTGATMDDTAAIMQAEFNNLPVPFANRILLRWVAGSQPRTGHFVVTSPFRGAGASLIEFEETGTGTTMVGSRRPFDTNYLTPTAAGTAGVGTVVGLADEQSPPVAGRWSQVPPPGQADRRIDARRLPLLMRRASVDPLRFEIERMPAKDREAGDNLTNPSPQMFRSAVLSGIITEVTLDGTPPPDADVIVKSEAHGLVTDDLIQITGAANGVAGYRIVTRIDDDTFKIRSQATGNVIQLGTVPANQGGFWTKDAATITDAYFYRDRFWIQGGGFVVSSQTGDLFNFYLQEPPQVIDSDPIERRASANEFTILSYALPVRRSVVMFSNNGHQFELNSLDAITPTSVSLETTTNHPMQAVRPVAVDASVFFVSPNGDFDILSEYIVEEQGITYSIGNASGHADRFVPKGITRLVSDPVRYQLFLVARGTNEFYAYREFWRGREQVQAAWTRYRLDANARILDACRIRDELFLLIRRGSVWSFESMALGEVKTPTGLEFTPMLDRFEKLTGTHSGGTTTWTPAGPIAGHNTAVLPDGTVLALTVSGSDLTAAGDHSAVEAVVGASYPCSVALTRPFYRGEDGVPDIDTRPIVGKVIVATEGGADYAVSVVDASGTLIETKTGPESLESVNVRGMAADRPVTLLSTGPRRVVFSGVSWRTEPSEVNW